MPGTGRRTGWGRPTLDHPQEAPMSATRTQTRSEDEQPDEAESSEHLIALTSTLGGLGATTLTLMLTRS